MFNKIKSTEKAGLWDWVKAISTLAIVGVVLFKVYQTPLNITVDFPALLSLLLALFSVGLSALFYFKATDSSSAFYDNTYKFTKDIAQLLTKIESGFGEKLGNLEKNVSNLGSSTIHKKEIEKVKKQVQDDQRQVEEQLDQRDKELKEAMEKAKVNERGMKDIMEVLSHRDRQLKEATDELNKTQNRLNELEKSGNHGLSKTVKDKHSKLRSIVSAAFDFHLGENDYFFLTNKELSKAIVNVIEGLNKRNKELLGEFGYYFNGITEHGWDFVVGLLEDNYGKRQD
ncbi:hypothetical protein EYS14_01585 [Alteromonadaceae bacterium M269]|nr:hypothetical protein EYS14_01585 [Alteromonadaceae bacterium M269]